MELGKEIQNKFTCWEVYEKVRRETEKNSNEFQSLKKLKLKLSSYNLIVWI